MIPEENAVLRKKVESEFPEENVSARKLVETLMKSFLKSDSNYGAITDIKMDVNRIYKLVKNYIKREKLDIYALKLEDSILLSKTGVGFEEICNVVREHSYPKIKKNMIEIWDDAENKILHLILVPFRKHFPIEYSDEKEKIKMIEKFSSMRW